MIMYNKAIVRRAAAVNLDGSDGCFVTLAAGAVTPAAADTEPAAVYGILNSTTDTVGEGVSVILPGCDCIPGAKVAATSDPVADGDTLVLAAGGTVAKGSTGTMVAVALGAAVAGDMVPVRLVEPVELVAED